MKVKIRKVRKLLSSNAAFFYRLAKNINISGDRMQILLSQQDLVRHFEIISSYELNRTR